MTRICKYYLIRFLLTLNRFTDDLRFSTNLYNFLLDAIRAILVYSQNVEELLRRKKVHREVIFKYLATQGVIVPPATEKHNLIQHAKDYWQKQSHLKLKETPEPVKTEDIRLFQQVKIDIIVIP